MELNQKLFELMEWLESGLYWKWHVNQPVDDMLRHLMREGCCEAREDIAPDLLRLTQKGKIALELARKEAAGKAKEDADSKAREAARLKERREDRADAERRYRGQNQTAIIAACLSAALGFLLGVLTEHFGSVIDLIASVFH